MRPLTPVGRLVFIFILMVLLALLATFASGQTPAAVRIVVLPGEFTPGGVTARPQIEDAMREVISDMNAAAMGKTVFSFDVGPVTEISRQPGTCNQQWANEASIAAQAAGLVWDKAIFLQQYDNLCRYGGEAALGGPSAFENSGTNTFVIEHELYHTLGLPHSWGAFFINGIIGDFAHAQLKEYGHPTDVMSGGNTLSALWRYRLGWLAPIRIPRDGQPHRVHLRAITQAQDAFVIQRDDGIEYWGEHREAGQAKAGGQITASYNGVPTWVETIAVGEDYNDTVGGVLIRSVGDGDYIVQGVPPTYVPPVVLEPTPGPVQNTPTPPAAECWAQFPFIRCSPTPGATETPTPTPSPSPTTTAMPTDTPTPTASSTPEPSPTPTDTPAPAPTGVAFPTTPAAPPSTVPGLPRPRGGCGMNTFGIVLTGGSLWIWKRRRAR